MESCTIKKCEIVKKEPFTREELILSHKNETSETMPLIRKKKKKDYAYFVIFTECMKDNSIEQHITPYKEYICMHICMYISFE